MNKRIEELAKQHLMHERFTRYGESVQEDYYEFYPEELLQFAKSIVRECASVAKETRWAVPPSQEQIARSIKQHFGVE